MPELFDMKLRAMRRDRAARTVPELFLLERAFDDCLDRVVLMERRFESALLIGCPDPSWRDRLGSIADTIEVRDPGGVFAARARGDQLVEDQWDPTESAFDLILGLGTLDTVNELPLALRLIRVALRPGGVFLGALSGGETLPQLRSAMRAADTETGAAAPHVHPRIEASALAPLLEAAGFSAPVVDVDRVRVSYSSLGGLVADIRAMGASNMLTARPKFVGRAARAAAFAAFAAAGDGNRTVETFEILHFVGWATNRD